MRSNTRLSEALLAFTLLAGCGSTERTSDAGVRTDARIVDDAGAADAGAADAGEPDGGVAIGVCAPTGSGCPSHVVTGEDFTCALDLTGAPNLIEDVRLEFGSGPDHAILFQVPSSGRYAIDLGTEPSTNGGCGVSASDADSTFHTTSECPAAGSVGALDGVYTGGEAYPVDLTAGQQIVLFVGCTEWSDAESGPYTLRVRRL